MRPPGIPAPDLSRRRGAVPPLAACARRAVLCCALPLAAGPALGGDDDIPELSPPVDAQAPTTPPRLVNPPRAITSIPAPVRSAAPAAAVASPAASPAVAIPGSAMLAMPGLTMPAPTSRPAPAATLDPAPIDPAAPEMSLDGPLEMPSPAANPTRTRATGRSEPAPIPDPPFENQLQPLPDLPGKPTTSAPRRLDSSSVPRSSSTVVPTPARRGRFFGLFPAPVVVAPAAAAGSRATSAGLDGRSASVGADGAAAAEAALESRIEKQARSAVGDRARSIGVEVNHKTATVQARGVKFYQKRGVRKALEGLPALSGLRTTIEVLD